MPITPGLLPSPALTKRGRRSRLLFHWRARDLSVDAVSGQVGTFTRASPGGATRDLNGRLWTPVHSQPRWDVPVAGGEVGLLLEYARTNLALWSSDFSQVASWAGSADFTQSVAASIVAGQVARKHVNNNTANSRNRAQNVGVLSATGDMVYAIVENVDSVTTTVGLYDQTALAFVHSATFTWATRTLATAAGSGSKWAVQLAEVGPNGGPVYLLAVSGVGTVGNTRRLIVYPSGVTQNGLTAILHHAQLESGRLDPSSPIVTGAASVTRATDRLTYPCNLSGITPDADDFTLYARFARPLHADASGNITDFPGILSLGGVNPQVFLYFSASSRALGAEVRDGGGTTLSRSAAVPAGATIEVLLQVRDLFSAPAAALDVGSGLGAFGTNGLLPITTFGTPLIGLGEIGDGSGKLGSSIYEAKIAQGLLSMDQMREAF